MRAEEGRGGEVRGRGRVVDKRSRRGAAAGEEQQE